MCRSPFYCWLLRMRKQWNIVLPRVYVVDFVATHFCTLVLVYLSRKWEMLYCCELWLSNKMLASLKSCLEMFKSSVTVRKCVWWWCSLRGFNTLVLSLMIVVNIIVQTFVHVTYILGYLMFKRWNYLSVRVQPFSALFIMSLCLLLYLH